MLALGIPGSATSAIMFGALTIHGLVPGQSLFAEHGDVVYTFLGGMFIATIFMVLIGVLFSKLEIPNTPIVLGLILGGIIESNYVRTLTIVKATGTNIFVYIMTRPICILIILVTAYLIWANIRAIRKGRMVQKESSIEQDVQDE